MPNTARASTSSFLNWMPAPSCPGRVPVLPDDTPEALAARLLPREHALLVAVLRLASEGQLAEQGDITRCHGQPLLNPLSLDSADRLAL